MPILDQNTPQSYIPYLATGTGVFSANGSPEGVQNGGIGSIYTDLLTGNLYTKTTVYATLTGWVLAGGGGGTGTVTSFSAGNLSPLFTTSVATATTTPALTFAQVSQSQNLFFASPNGSAGNPTFRAIATADLAGVALASAPADSIQFNNGTNGFTSRSDALIDSATGTLQLGKVGVSNGKLQFRSNVSGSIQLTVNQPGASYNYILADTAPTLGQVPTVSNVAGVNFTFDWLTPGSGSVNPGVTPRLAYYPTSGSTVDDTAGVEYLHSSSQTLFAQAQSTLQVPMSLKYFSSGQVADFLQCLDASDVSIYKILVNGGFGAGGDSYFSLTGSSTTFPRKLQLQNIAAGNAFRFEFVNEGTSIAQRDAGKFQAFSQFGMKFVGTRNSALAASFESGASTDPAVLIENGLTTVPALRVNAITSTSVSAFAVSSNLTDVASISASGRGNLDGLRIGDMTVGNTKQLAVTDGTSIRFLVSPLTPAVWLGSGIPLAWDSNTAAGNTQDLNLRRLAAASLVQGLANNATPVANLFTIGESSRGGTDSNVAGANGTLQCGLGTGNATPAQLILRSPLPGSTGTTAQSYGTGLTIVNGTARTTGYTVATLPSASVAGAGARAHVTDATTPTFGATVVGGGAVLIPVYSDGSGWLVG